MRFLADAQLPRRLARWLRSEPHRLCLIATGNIGNRELEGLFRDNPEHVVSALDEYDFVELDHTSLIRHR